MLLVKTTVGPSRVAGLGLFADEFIPKGAYIWRFKKGFDMRVGSDYPDILPEPARSYFLKYAYQNKDTLRYVLCADDARFFNHADTPNTACIPDPDDEETANVSVRDIHAGEELTIDYRTFDANPFDGFAA